jgi:hypothetical protein
MEIENSRFEEYKHDTIAQNVSFNKRAHKF